MISKKTLTPLLSLLCFNKRGSIHSKTIGTAVLKVDTKQERITYPDGLTVNDEFTCNFSSLENFVVLECVNRLLEKGYKPEHIEVEPKWKLCHGMSGGRADILVTDHQKKPLLLIECKTPGREFEKAWRNTLQDGDQLFSYAQQIAETQFLCLYTSDFDGAAISYTSHIIAHRDNQKYLADNPLFKSFASASDVKERFAVWRDTYKHDYTTKGIFESIIPAYQIGKDKYALDDLQAISTANQQKKYHEFATILRQHNVSGRENAFDKLVNLFLCKLVDETENPNDLKFYWKGVAYDTHFELLDRLQQLYQAGMDKFLGEDITYINQNDVNNALRFIRQNPDATQRAVWNLFVQQKSYTNNDFSLIDVHNEKLFYQNAEVLLEILQMWKGFKAKSKTEQFTEIEKRFLTFVQGIERDKLYHFVMASDQSNPVLIIRSPNDNKAQKRFLGFEWSSAKGSEGIKLSKDASGHHLTLLYDETDRNNAEKLNSLIAKNFQAASFPSPSGREARGEGMPPALSEYASTARLVDMLDFSRVTFEKQIALTAKKSVLLFSSRYPMEKLANFHSLLRRGKSAKYGESSIRIIKSGQARGHFEFDFSEKHFVKDGFVLDERQLQPGDLLINSTGKGTAGRVTYFDFSGVFVVNSHVSILRPNSRLNPKFGLYSLARIGFKALESLADGASGQIELTLGTIGAIQIPLPPVEVQQQIVIECEAVDAEAEAAQTSISTAHSTIEHAVSQIYSSHYPMQKLGNANISLLNPSKSEIKNVTNDTLVTFVEMSAVSEAGLITAPVNKPLKELRKGSYTYFAENDIILAKITPCMENGKCALAKGLENRLGMGSSEFHVVRANQQSVLPKYLFALLNRQSIFAVRRVPVTFYANLDVPVPPLAEQQKLVAEIETLERSIAAAQAVIATAPAKKQAIMQRCL